MQTRLIPGEDSVILDKKVNKNVRSTKGTKNAAQLRHLLVSHINYVKLRFASLLQQKN